MSKLAQNDGDDYPEAARKHCDDASVLNAGGRPDGSAYLAGYVVECALKTLLRHEGRTPPRGKKGHDLTHLAGLMLQVRALAGAKTAIYLTSPVLSVCAKPIASWDPEIRYRAPSMTPAAASTWLGDAQAIYKATVGQMFLDGVL
jgi:hypothetical protein